MTELISIERPYNRLNTLGKAIVAAQVVDFQEYVSGLHRQIENAIAQPQPRKRSRRKQHDSKNGRR